MVWTAVREFIGSTMQLQPFEAVGPLPARPAMMSRRTALGPEGASEVTGRV